jgi:hypothetical protein
MPEIKLFYKNCNCCSGSGSSGSGSCSCGFLQSVCPEATECKTKFHVTVNVSFANCGSTPFGSCSSGSGASGAETGLDGPETGSGSDCLETCPSCCDLVAKKYELDLDCYLIGSNDWALVSDNLNINPASPSLCAEWGLEGAQDSCKGPRNGCTFFSIQVVDGVLIYAIFGTPIDGGMFWGFGTEQFLQDNLPCSPSVNVDSCNPLQISGNLLAFANMAGISDNPNTFNYLQMPCFGSCLFPEGLETATSESIIQRFCCISITYTITEALP